MLHYHTCFKNASLAQAATEAERVLTLIVEQLLNTTTEGRKRRVRSMLMLIVGINIKNVPTGTGVGIEERATLLKHSSQRREERNGGKEEESALMLLKLISGEESVEEERAEREDF